MKNDKKYYKNIDIFRLLACLAILLYHLDVLKGGYLAVCVFFVLSSYLSCISAFKSKDFSLRKYYLNRVVKLYFPLVIVIFITISIISIFSNITWFNLKPETTSVLLGYNNFWQLSANLDYFARHVDSPFLHFWYIAILLQFNLIFPIIYILLRKIGDKINKLIPSIVLFLLSIIGTLYFGYISINKDIMITYYDTFSRAFSLCFGLFLGFTHSYYRNLIPKLWKKENIFKMIFSMYLIIMICFFIFVDAKTIFFVPSMIIITIISCRLIEYATINHKENLSIVEICMKQLSEITYEIYLVQYPVVFLFQYVNINAYFKTLIIIILVLILSYLLHFALHLKKYQKLKILQYTILTIMILTSLYGCYQFSITEDHTTEMKQLKEQLKQNENLLQKKHEEYLLQSKQEKEDWMSTLKELENGENELKNIVTNLSIIGIGDSVMLGAIDNLYKEFPNGYFDAKISRTAWVVNSILQNLKKQNMLGNPIILNLGANGDCPENCKIEIMETCESRDVFWINTTNDIYINQKLSSLASKYNNLYIIDWYSISKGHPEYFYADGIHLTEKGKEEYIEAIYESIYQKFLKEYNVKKSEIINNHEKVEKNKISFYGNDLLLNIFSDLQNDFNDAKFVIHTDFNYQLLKIKLEEEIKNSSLTHKIAFAFDESANISLLEYQELMELCAGHEVYILLLNKSDIFTLENENVKLIYFYQDVQNHKDYLMADKIHLTKKGNEALSKIIISTIK